MEDEKIGRTNILCDSVFNMGFYEWPAILKLHAAILTEIQSGVKSWDSDFSRLEQQMLMPFPLKKGKKVDKKFGKGDRKDDEEKTLFCNLYQKGTCTHNELSHTSNFFGRPATVHHICANCLLKNKTKQYHPDTSTECPFHQN